MNNKKLTAILLSVVFIISLAACGNDKNIDDKPITNDEMNITEEYDEYTEPDNEEITYDMNSNKQTISKPTENKTDTTAVSEIQIDPAKWTKAEIVDFYKNAAEKSNKTAKSEQTITLKDFSINNGQYESVIGFIMPLMSKFLASNSTEKDGITGGYKNLVEADVSSAKAYKSGKNTVIEMVMVNQTDGAKGDMLGGTVGHAISVVGDITDVTNQLSEYGLPAIEVSGKDTKIYYTDATVKVVISPDGKIVNGTWKYTVDINLNNYKVADTTVENTSIVMDNVITVNGGFSK